jgi:hypothetical protein
MNSDLGQLIISFLNDHSTVLLAGAVNTKWLGYSRKTRDQIVRSFAMIRWMKRMQIPGYYGQSLTCYTHFNVYQTPAWPGLGFAWYVMIERRGEEQWTGFVMIDPLKGAVFVASFREDSEQEGPSDADVKVFRDAREFIWCLDQLQSQVTHYDLPLGISDV